MSGGVADLDKLIRKGISSLKLRINDKTSKDRGWQIHNTKMRGKFQYLRKRVQ